MITFTWIQSSFKWFLDMCMIPWVSDSFFIKVGKVLISNLPFEIVHFLRQCAHKKPLPGTCWHGGLTRRPIEMVSCQDAFLSRPLEYAVGHHRPRQDIWSAVALLGRWRIVFSPFPLRCLHLIYNVSSWLVWAPPLNNSYTLFKVVRKKTVPQEKNTTLKKGIQLATIEI